jgi:hypothetical protein
LRRVGARNCPAGSKYGDEPQMELPNDTKKLYQMLEQTQQAVQHLALAFSASAAVQLAAEFYTKEERVELIAQYESLRLTVQNAQYVHNAGLVAKVDPEVRRSKYEALSQAQAAQKAFEQQHGLISALCDAKTALGTPSRT